jgi:hypothetical protein
MNSDTSGTISDRAQNRNDVSSHFLAGCRNRFLTPFLPPAFKTACRPPDAYGYCGGQTHRDEAPADAPPGRTPPLGSHFKARGPECGGGCPGGPPVAAGGRNGRGRAIPSPRGIPPPGGPGRATIRPGSTRKKNRMPSSVRGNPPTDGRGSIFGSVSRGDRTAIELFRAGMASWEGEAKRLL